MIGDRQPLAHRRFLGIGVLNSLPDPIAIEKDGGDGTFAAASLFYGGGIAYTLTDEDGNTAPSNFTIDAETGILTISDDELIEATTLKITATNGSGSVFALISVEVYEEVIVDPPLDPVLASAVYGRDYTIRIFEPTPGSGFWAPEFLIPTDSILRDASTVRWIKWNNTQPTDFPPNYPTSEQPDEGTNQVWRCEQNTGNNPVRERTAGSSSSNFGLTYSFDDVEYAPMSELTSWSVPAEDPLAPQYLGGLQTQSTVEDIEDTYDVSAFFSGDDLVFTISTHTGVSINSSTGVITVEVADPATLSIIVTATNGSGEATGAFTWHITVDPGIPGDNIVNVTTLAEARSAMLTHKDTAGTRVRLPSGFSGGEMVPITNTVFAGMTLESANLSNRAELTGSTHNGACLSFEGCTGVAIENIDFVAVKNVNNGCLWLKKSINCSVRRCTFTDGIYHITGNESRNLTIEFNTFSNVNVDYIRMYEDCDGARIRRNKLNAHDITTTTSLHRDFMQFGPSGSGRGSHDVVIEDNVLVHAYPDEYIQGIFMFNGNVQGVKPGTQGADGWPESAHENIVIRRNHVTGSHTNGGIALSGINGGQVYSNKIMRTAGSSTSKPRINWYGREVKCNNMQVYDNVTQSAMGWTDLLAGLPSTPFATNSTIENPTISNNPNVFPSGWLGLDVGHLAVDPQPSG